MNQGRRGGGQPPPVRPRTPPFYQNQSKEVREYFSKTVLQHGPSLKRVTQSSLRDKVRGYNPLAYHRSQLASRERRMEEAPSPAPYQRSKESDRTINRITTVERKFNDEQMEGMFEKIALEQYMRKEAVSFSKVKLKKMMLNEDAHEAEKLDMLITYDMTQPPSPPPKTPETLSTSKRLKSPDGSAKRTEDEELLSDANSKWIEKHRRASVSDDDWTWLTELGDHENKLKQDLKAEYVEQRNVVKVPIYSTTFDARKWRTDSEHPPTHEPTFECRPRSQAKHYSHTFQCGQQKESLKGGGFNEHAAYGLPLRHRGEEQFLRPMTREAQLSLGQSPPLNLVRPEPEDKRRYVVDAKKKKVAKLCPSDRGSWKHDPSMSMKELMKTPDCMKRSNEQTPHESKTPQLAAKKLFQHQKSPPRVLQIAPNRVPLSARQASIRCPSPVATTPQFPAATPKLTNNRNMLSQSPILPFSRTVPDRSPSSLSTLSAPP